MDQWILAQFNLFRILNMSTNVNCSHYKSNFPTKLVISTSRVACVRKRDFFENPR